MTIIGPLEGRHLEEGHRARLQDTGFARGRESERSFDIRVPVFFNPTPWCLVQGFSIPASLTISPIVRMRDSVDDLTTLKKLSGQFRFYFAPIPNHGIRKGRMDVRFSYFCGFTRPWVVSMKRKNSDPPCKSLLTITSVL